MVGSPTPFQRRGSRTDTLQTRVVEDSRQGRRCLDAWQVAPCELGAIEELGDHATAQLAAIELALAGGQLAATRFATQDVAKQIVREASVGDLELGLGAVEEAIAHARTLHPGVQRSHPCGQTGAVRAATQV